MTVSTLVFVLVVVGMLVHALTGIATRASLSATTRAAACVAVILLWVALPAFLAHGGALDRYSPLPAPALVLVALLGVATVILVFSPVGTALSEIDLVWLVGFQAFRLPVEWWLHRLFVEGVVPIQMTYVGRNFDVVTGLGALALGLWLAIGRPPRGLVLLWNVIGLALLVNIVTVAVLSTPVPFRYFLNDPPNLLPSTFPHVWLPSFLVPSALAGHLLVFRALRRVSQNFSLSGRLGTAPVTPSRRPRSNSQQRT